MQNLIPVSCFVSFDKNWKRSNVAGTVFSHIGLFQIDNLVFMNSLVKNLNNTIITLIADMYKNIGKIEKFIKVHNKLSHAS